MKDENGNLEKEHGHILNLIDERISDLYLELDKFDPSLAPNES